MSAEKILEKNKIVLAEDKYQPLPKRPNFRGRDGKLYLVRCPECKLENYSLSVAAGVCAWCGWHEGRVEDDTKN